jgi:SAM-dependent methyltransferase
MMLFTKTLTTLFFSAFTFTIAIAQQLHVPYVSTPREVVDKMMDIAHVGLADYVIDLGSGDGRIVIEAARRGAVGHGLEIDPDLLRKAQENARKAGVSERIMFLNKDVFKSDFSRATVITSYMTTTLNTRLRPTLLNDLEPGSRIVTHDFHMGEWKPDNHIAMGEHDIYYWVVPANIEGQWYWKTNGKNFSMKATQTFQEIRLKVRTEENSLKIEHSQLSGKNLNFTAINPKNGNRYIYHGTIEDTFLEGLVQIHHDKKMRIESWSANTIRSIQ